MWLGGSLGEGDQGERNWTWFLSNTQVKAITRGTKRLLQVVLRDQDTLSAQASKVNSDIKRSHRRRSGRRSKWPCRRLNRKRVVDFERRVRFELCSSNVVDEASRVLVEIRFRKQRM